MCRYHYIKRVLSTIHSFNVKECTSLYHIAEHRARRHERDLNYLHASLEWFFSGQLRYGVMMKLNNVESGHVKAIEYCINKQYKIDSILNIKTL